MTAQPFEILQDIQTGDQRIRIKTAEFGSRISEEDRETLEKETATLIYNADALRGFNVEIACRQYAYEIDDETDEENSDFADEEDGFEEDGLVTLEGNIVMYHLGEDEEDDTIEGVYDGLEKIKTPIMVGGIDTGLKDERLAHRVLVDRHTHISDGGLNSSEVSTCILIPVEGCVEVKFDTPYYMDANRIPELWDKFPEIMEEIDVLMYSDDLDLISKIKAMHALFSQEMFDDLDITSWNLLVAYLNSLEVLPEAARVMAENYIRTNPEFGFVKILNTSGTHIKLHKFTFDVGLRFGGDGSYSISESEDGEYINPPFSLILSGTRLDINADFMIMIDQELDIEPLDCC